MADHVDFLGRIQQMLSDREQPDTVDHESLTAAAVAADTANVLMAVSPRTMLLLLHEYAQVADQCQEAMTNWNRCELRITELTRERDLAIAHDRQPYPTADAYEAVCKALEKSKRDNSQLLAVVEAAVKWRDAHEVVPTASTLRRIAVVKISPCTDEEIDLAAAIDAMRKEVG